MNTKEWSADYETGIGAIDSDHQTLFQTVQQLGDYIEAGSEAGRISAVINSLILYVDEHFEREERFMRRAGYPGFQAHKDLHDQFRDSVFSLRDYQQNHAEEVDGKKIVSFLQDWLIEHITKVDMEYKPYLTGEVQGDPKLHKEPAAGPSALTAQVVCPEDKKDQVEHFIALISEGSEEGLLVEQAVEKITKVQVQRRKDKARKLFGK